MLGDASDTYYAPSVLHSEAISSLPDYTSKAQLAKVAIDLAKERFNTSEVQITDLYLYPDIEGVEFFYRLPNGVETNALLIDSRFLSNIEIETDQLQLELPDRYDSEIIWDGQQLLLEGDFSISSKSQRILFTCDNPKHCSPCQVITRVEHPEQPIETEAIGDEPKKITVRCGSCKDCSLKAEFTM